jgi:ribose transport system permease protein
VSPGVSGATTRAALATTSARRLASAVELRDFGIVVSFLALFITLAFASDAFLRERNLLNILDQAAPVGIIACAISICIIAGIFDLSTGAMFSAS